MADNDEESPVGGLRERIEAAFCSAYPEVPPVELQHMARNFAQVVSGIIEIGEKVGEGSGFTHMDVANGLVYACFANTYLAELREGRRDPVLDDPTVSRISDEEMERLMKECAARVADWLLGIDVLKEDPELLRRFVIGSVKLGAEGWEKDRGKLRY